MTFNPMIAVPTHDGSISVETHNSLAVAGGTQCFGTYSLLTGNFNRLYATALNGRASMGFTHFLMLHADVGCVEPDWVDRLHAAMETNGLGVVSGIVPIKNDSGEVSTAMMSVAPDEPTGYSIRRFKSEEIASIASGSTLIAGLRDIDATLLINTGCMLIDIRHPWADELIFRVQDERVQLADGTYAHACHPEDWLMSRWLKSRGVPYGATRAVTCVHVGKHVWK